MNLVTPYVGVWIEIICPALLPCPGCVTPYVGVWIEIGRGLPESRDSGVSPPMWGCGLKYPQTAAARNTEQVTPYVGVWIEIELEHSKKEGGFNVTPYVGVWIEIALACCAIFFASVTPYVGVWIEITNTAILCFYIRRHPLCGGVD